MKKITLSLVVMLIATISFAQTNVVDALSASTNLDLSVISEATITPVGQNRGIVDTYATRPLFIAACPNVTDLEDFGGGPSAIAGCGPVISAAGEVCFPPGEILAGIEVTRDGGADTVYVPAGSFGNASPIVGANTFVNYTIVNFPSNNVNSFGFDIYALTAGGDVSIRINGTGGLIATYSVSSPGGNVVFFGAQADEIITSVELEDLTGVNAELIGNAAFGICNILGVSDNLLSQVSIYPNPATDVLNVNIPSTVTVTRASLVNILGKDTGMRLVNGEMNISSLAQGVYILTLYTSAGNLTQKVIKK